MSDKAKSNSETSSFICTKCNHKNSICENCEKLIQKETDKQSCCACERNLCIKCIDEDGFCDDCEETHGCSICEEKNSDEPSPGCDKCYTITCRGCMIQFPNSVHCREKTCVEKSPDYISFLISLTKYSDKPEEAHKAFIDEKGKPYNGPSQFTQ